MKKPELLAPAGSLEKAKIAMMYGADAIYCSAPSLGLRAPSAFGWDEIAEARKLAKEKNVGFYIALNAFLHDGVFGLLPAAVRRLRDEIKPDALIIADFGVASVVRREWSEAPIHVSTQANLVNFEACLAWKKFFDVKRVVLARELREHEVFSIAERLKKENVEVEFFGHGAQCMAMSGRCLISNFLAQRGANQGVCVQSCRWKYKARNVKDENYEKTPELALELEEEKRSDEWMRVEEWDDGTYFFNAVDQCQLSHLAKICESDVAAVKIEGRNKTEFYLATVVRAWRRALDGEWSWERAFEDVQKIDSRGLATGFFGGEETGKGMNLKTTKKAATWHAAGKIVGKGEFLVANRFFPGAEITFLPPVGENITLKMEKLEKVGGEIVESVHGGAGTVLRVRDVENLPVGTIARMVAK